MRNTKKRLLIWASAIMLLLVIPLISMQFTDEVNWDLADFLIMGTALVSIALIYEFIARRSEKTIYRAAVIVGLLGAFLLFWVNGAVGIIGNEGQTANLLFISVFVVGFIGALIARFKPLWMARTLFTTASVQMLVPVVALIIWPPSTISWSPGVFGVFLMTAFFASLFILSGILFKKAGQQSTKARN